MFVWVVRGPGVGNNLAGNDSTDSDCAMGRKRAQKFDALKAERFDTFEGTFVPEVHELLLHIAKICDPFRFKHEEIKRSLALLDSQDAPTIFAEAFSDANGLDMRSAAKKRVMLGEAAAKSLKTSLKLTQLARESSAAMKATIAMHEQISPDAPIIAALPVFMRQNFNDGQHFLDIMANAAKVETALSDIDLKEHYTTLAETLTELQENGKNVLADALQLAVTMFERLLLKCWESDAEAFNAELTSAKIASLEQALTDLTSFAKAKIQTHQFDIPFAGFAASTEVWKDWLSFIKLHLEAPTAEVLQGLAPEHMCAIVQKEAAVIADLSKFGMQATAVDAAKELKKTLQEKAEDPIAQKRHGAMEQFLGKLVAALFQRHLFLPDGCPTTHVPKECLP